MLERVRERGLVLLGCGKMGSALLEGWLRQGVPPESVTVIEPHPSDWLRSTGVALNTGLPPSPAIVLLAVKPQMMGAALPAVTALGGGTTVFLSIAAGTTIASFETAFGPATPIIRAMPNTPAAVARGITAIIGNARASEADLALAETLLSAVGQVVRLEREDQMDAVTAVSGSGPAYVFHLIEALAAAGVAQGLPEALAMQLARATVCGAGELAHQSAETAAQLRINVTSPGGTTAAALSVLMAPDTGLPPLMARAVQAAADRGRELGK
ncbi:pyrroline-5-carboxylate reductase [Gemmobacter denitrificans]|uniref:Pyrroline-5-carboxylate reductase n=1 Tax=Gemmobacter denitrificans TaxID=3123040 RepID=A0ABU8BYC6_9RHOB